MQNRYVGDVGDFGKYGLLRALCMPDGDKYPALRLGVVWYLTSDETHNNDGRHIGYLEPTPKNLQAFRACDPSLYDNLGEIVRSGDRSVSAIRRKGILPEDTIYYERILDLKGNRIRSKPSSRVLERQEWVAGALESTQTCHVVFVDPDNGIGTMAQAYSRLGSKYVLLEELLPYYDRGQTLVIYHHLNRQATAEIQIEERLTQARQQVGVSAQVMALRYRRGSPRVFYILTKDTTVMEVLDKTLARFADVPWCEHFVKVN